MLSYVRQMTDRNHHCEARVYLAQHVLRDPELTAWYRAALEVRNRQGYMTSGQARAVYQLDTRVLRGQLAAKGLADYYEAL